MTILGNVRRVKASRKAKKCDWCYEIIEVGRSKVSYFWAAYGNSSSTNMHPECFDASGRAASEWGYDFEFLPGSYSRGCECEKGNCECKEQIQ